MKLLTHSLATLFLVALFAVFVGCANDSSPLAPASDGVEANGAGLRAPTAVPVVQVDQIANQYMDFMLQIIDNLTSENPRQVAQAIADLESLRPGITQEILNGLAGAAGAAIIEIDLPNDSANPAQGGEHTVTIVVTGTVTVKAGGTITVAGVETEFVEDTTVKIDETFEFVVDCGEGCTITSHTRTTKNFDGENIKAGDAQNGVDITVEGKITVDVKVKPCCEEGETGDVKPVDSNGR